MASIDDGSVQDWCPARLIPVVGIRNREEQEKRASSCLLAVMHAVPEFAHGLLKELGAPKVPPHTFTEVRFKDDAGKTVIPDGAIVCRRGSRSWRCLVEVKTARAQLRDEQVMSYVAIAREHGFDGVLTISSAITGNSTESPVAIDKRRLGKVKLWHFSWWQIITEAIVQAEHRRVSDPDQDWILRELIAYLQHPNSGASGFDDMGDKWVKVRSDAHDGTLRADDPAARDVTERWSEFGQFVAMSLSQDLGRRVTVVRRRNQTATARMEEDLRRLADAGVLGVALRVPDAVGNVEIEVDLRARQTRVSVSLDAPRDVGRPETSIRWLLRQLSGEVPRDLRVEASYPNAREPVAATLETLKEDVAALTYPPDRKRLPRSFRLTSTRRLGQKRGRGDGSFVRETQLQTVEFYGDLVQQLKPWRPKPPQLPDSPGATSSHGNGESDTASAPLTAAGESASRADS